ncbi:MAG: hypothetical protein R3Y28_04285 [Candidatus Gastranaerophilales bacterium]
MLKKLFCTILFVILCQSTAFADVKTYYNLYTILNSKDSDIETLIMNTLKSENDFEIFQDETDRIYYYQRPKEDEDEFDTYYIRYYQDFDNTNIFVGSSSRKAKNSNDVETILIKTKTAYEELKDKQIKEEYQFDFIRYAREKKLPSLKVVPKKTQWFEDTVDKIDAKLIKDNKDVPQVAYKNNTDEIELRKLSTEEYHNEEFQITKNKYKLKEKTYKFAHAYEYTLKNNTDDDLIINKVDSNTVINIKDVTKSTYIDLDRIDAIAYTGSFLAPFTLGLSMLACIPDWVRTATIQTESIKFTYEFPQDYTIPAGESINILVLRDRENPDLLRFDLSTSTQNYYFEF